MVPVVTIRPIRLAELAAVLERSFEGEGDFEIKGVAALESAGPSDLSFVRSERWSDAVSSSAAGAVIAPEGVDVGGRAVIRSPQPGLDFARAVRRIRPMPRPPAGIDPGAHVADDAQLDPTAAVGPGCVVGSGARVGAGSILHANVTLYAGVVVGVDCRVHAGCVLREGTVLGDRVALQPGVMLGGDGFGYLRNEKDEWESVPQTGGVVLEDDVEIGANVTIDRGTLGDTVIRRGAKIDDLCLIAHNCDVGENVLIAGQVGIAGSVEIGRDAILLAQVGVVDHVRIGARAYVGAQSGVTADLETGARVFGTPALDLPLGRRVAVSLRRIPELLRRMRRLESRVDAGASNEGESE